MNKIELKREKRKNDIIQAAVELFREKGFEKVSLLEIAQKKQMGRTTIYEYFKNKNEILAAYLEKEMVNFNGKTIGALTSEGNFKSKLKKLILVQLDYTNRHQGFRELFGALAREGSEIAQSTYANLRKEHERLYRVMSEELNKAMANKEIRKISPQLFVQVIFNIFALPLHFSKGVEEAADEICAYFWQGLALDEDETDD